MSRVTQEERSKIIKEAQASYGHAVNTTEDALILRVIQLQRLLAQATIIASLNAKQAMVIAQQQRTIQNMGKTHE